MASLQIENILRGLNEFHLLVQVFRVKEMDGAMKIVLCLTMLNLWSMKSMKLTIFLLTNSRDVLKF